MSAIFPMFPFSISSPRNVRRPVSIQPLRCSPNSINPSKQPSVIFYFSAPCNLIPVPFYTIGFNLYPLLHPSSSLSPVNRLFKSTSDQFFVTSGPPDSYCPVPYPVPYFTHSAPVFYIIGLISSFLCVDHFFTHPIGLPHSS